MASGGFVGSAMEAVAAVQVTPKYVYKAIINIAICTGKLSNM